MTTDEGVIAPNALLGQALVAQLRVTLHAIADVDTAQRRHVWLGDRRPTALEAVRRREALTGSPKERDDALGGVALPRGIRPAALTAAAWSRVLRSPVLMGIVSVTALQGAGQFVLFSYFGLQRRKWQQGAQD